MKLPANIRAQVAQIVAAQPAPATALARRPGDALANVDGNALLTREDRLAWLRSFATGAMTFPKYVRGMVTQVGADPPLRLRAVEVIARIEGDLKESPFAGMNVEKMVVVVPSNGRERMDVIEAESGDA